MAKGAWKMTPARRAYYDSKNKKKSAALRSKVIRMAKESGGKLTKKQITKRMESERWNTMKIQSALGIKLRKKRKK